MKKSREDADRVQHVCQRFSKMVHMIQEHNDKVQTGTDRVQDDFDRLQKVVARLGDGVL